MKKGGTFFEGCRRRLFSSAVVRRELNGPLGDVYLWTALDAETKPVAAYLVGKRSADNARRLMTDLSHRLVFPAPHATDAHAYQKSKQITTT